MFNKRIFLLLFLLIITIGAISSVSANEDIGDSNHDEIEVDGNNDIDVNTSNQPSEIIDESDDVEDEVLSASEDNVLQDNTNGRDISELQNLINRAPSGTSIDLKFDYYCTSQSNLHGVAIEKPITINGNGHTIDANEHSRIFHILSEGVVINDLTFRNAYYYRESEYFLGHGGAIYIEDVTTTFNNCNFYDNAAEQNGGAICSGGGLVINKCKFIRNEGAGAKRTMTEDTIFGYGGAIYAFSSVNGDREIRITDSTFSNNKARAAGALYIDYSTQDYNNHDVPYGLKCFIKNCQFNDNSAEWGGGAIYNCRDLDISDSTFSGNTGRSGGAILLENGHGIIDMYFHYVPVNLAVHGNTVFSNNVAEYNGGAVEYSFIGSTFESTRNDFLGSVKVYDNVLFESNRANKGGALYVTDIELTVNNARFISNIANTDAGAMYGGTAIGCTFNGNSVPQTSNTKIVNTAKLTVAQSGSNWNNKVITATLTDGNSGSGLANQYLDFNLNGKVTRIMTNSLGKAILEVTLPGSYSATISYGGNSKYTAASTNAKVVVSKITPKLVASKKSFKVKVSTKKYTVTLKDNLGRAIKNTKLTINVKGKTYSAKTTANGKATFKITKLKKKGKFNAKIKFSGNANYNAVTKTVKITVK